MPHFTLQISPQGPLLDAAIGVSGARRTVLEAANQPIPQSERIRALVDTGASNTCIDPTIFTALGLTPTGRVPMATPSTGTTPHEADQYDVSLMIPARLKNEAPLYFDTIAVSSCELVTLQGFHALIGRDILSRCILIYDGTYGVYTLTY